MSVLPATSQSHSHGDPCKECSPWGWFETEFPLLYAVAVGTGASKLTCRRLSSLKSRPGGILLTLAPRAIEARGDDTVCGLLEGAQPRPTSTLSLLKTCRRVEVFCVFELGHPQTPKNCFSHLQSISVHPFIVLLFSSNVLLFRYFKIY